MAPEASEQVAATATLAGDARVTGFSTDGASAAPAPADDTAHAAAAAFAVENFSRAVVSIEDLIRWLVHVKAPDRVLGALLEQLLYDAFHIHLSTPTGRALLAKLSPVAGDALLVLRKRRPRLDPLVDLLLSGDVSGLEQARPCWPEPLVAQPQHQQSAGFTQCFAPCLCCACWRCAQQSAGRSASRVHAAEGACGWTER